MNKEDKAPFDVIFWLKMIYINIYIENQKKGLKK